MKNTSLSMFVGVMLGILLVVPLARADIPALERDALIALYNSTNGASWNNNENWLGPPGTENTWYGINASNTHVTAISLTNNNLVGTIPTELGNLTNLQQLSLSDNQLAGSIPPELGNLTNLQHLSLRSNELSGSIPTEIGNLTDLQWLHLSNNQLTGSIPNTMKQLTKLVVGGGLSLDWNGLYTTDSDLRDFLNNKSSSDFEATQTVAPANLTPNQLSPTSVELTWTPIAYTGNEGGYRVYYSNSRGGPFSLFDETMGKTDTSLTVTGLTPDTKYCFYMETVTYPHANNQNTVVSEKSPIVGSCSMTMPWAPLLLLDD
jgi:hypothetical protein